MEFAHVGARCSAKDCSQQDFLPFTCDRCKLMFCLDHRTYKDHNCTAEPVGASSGGSGSGAKAAEEFKYKCALPSCGAAERFDIKCPDCTLQLCMKHRNALDHDCAASKKAVTGQKKRAEDFLAEHRGTAAGGGAGASASGKTKATRKRKTPKQMSAKNRERARKFNLMRLKAKAEGIGTVPAKEQFIVAVSHTVAGKKSPYVKCFKRSWTVGKAIDIVAAKLDVSHRVDEANGKDRWWLMPLESDVPFHPRSKLGDLSSSDGDGDGSVMPGDEIRFVKGPLTDDDIVKQVTE